VSASEVRALDPGRRIAEALHDRWSLRDGLPSDVVQAVLRTSDGFLWVGTQHGLVRFDGSSFTALDRTTRPAIPAGSVTALLEAQGGLWVGFDGAGALVVRGGAAARIEATRVVPRTYVRALVRDPAQAVWIATAGGLVRVHQGQAAVLDQSAGLPANNTRTLAVDATGAVWASTAAGLARQEGQGFRPLPLPTGEPPPARVLLAEADGVVWLGGEKEGLHRWRGGALERLDGRGALPPLRPTALLRDRAGSLWVGTTGAGLLRVSASGAVDRLSRQDGLGSDHVSALAEDDEGALWIGTRGGGLHRLRDAPFLRIGEAQGLPDDRVNAVATAPDGSVWIAGQGGITRWHEGTVTRPGEDPELSANGVFVDRAGGVWASTSRGLARVETDRLVPVAVRPEGRHAIAEADDGLWIVARDLHRLQDGGLTTSSLPHPSASHPYVGPSGTLWIAAGRFVLERRGGTFVEHRLAPDDAPDVAVALHEDATGGLWIGCIDGGLKLLRQGRVVSFGTGEGLPSSSVFSIVEDDAGRLWMASPRGLFWVARADLERAAEPPGGAVRAVLFGPEDGVSIRQQLQGLRLGARGADGRLWFATERGALAVDPAHAPADALPASVLIEGLFVDGRSMTPADGLRLPARTRTIEVRYTAPLFGPAYRAHFRHRLEGAGSGGWVDAGARRTVNFVDLGPGTYTFRVGAGAADGRMGPNTAALTFTVLPPFYRTYPFYAALALALALLVAGLHRLRLRQYRARYQAVLEERGRIARELHDDLTQGLVAVTTQVQCARQAMTHAPDQVDVHLDEAAQAAQATLEGARRAVWALRPRALEDADLASALERVARQLDSPRTRVVLELDGPPPALPEARAREVLRIAQEALSNALRHAAASRVVVRLGRREDQVELCVRDDGQGFDRAATAGRPGHHGLVHLEERARAAGGRLEIESAPGAGTAIIVRVPLA
jgi:signal transduction histidine kinase/ligand-binding sensor domain-containing protein